jgi:methionyl aminopeptidase
MANLPNSWDEAWQTPQRSWKKHRRTHIALKSNLCYELDYIMEEIIIKTKEQIEGIRRSSRLAALSLNYIEPFVEAGVTTGELDWRLEEFMRANGAIPACLGYQGFPKATCISINEVICHGVPGDVKLKDGDIFNIDVTTILDGYFGDTSTMFTIGEISEDAEHIIKVAKHCLKIGIQQVFPGNRFGNIGYEITKYAHLQLTSVVERMCGHGTGIFFHEKPEVQHYITEKDTGPIMKSGMVFTVEPMLCLGGSEGVVCEEDGWTIRTVDGKLSAQFEHTVLCTDTGVEILTL